MIPLFYHHVRIVEGRQGSQLGYANRRALDFIKILTLLPYHADESHAIYCVGFHALDRSPKQEQLNAYTKPWGAPLHQSLAWITRRCWLSLAGASTLIK